MVERRSPFYGPDHDAFRATIRRFVEREVAPHVDAWDEAGAFPRELYAKAAAIGLLGLGFPEAYGGVEADRFTRILATQEFARCGSGGVAASLFSHTIGAPPIARRGSTELKARVLPKILSGEKISALAITEPGGGSDVANLQTRARREGDHYVVDGAKTFITSGMRADFLTVAVRTGGPGAGGVSLLLIDGDTPGLQRTPLKKMGWWASDTATLYFEGCRVPAANLIGEQNAGFRTIMLNFNDERLHMAAGAIAFARVCLDESIGYARERRTFGKSLSEHQVIRHKLVDMAMRIEASQAMLEALTWRLEQGDNPVAELCMLKNQATTTLAFCASEGVQIFGGAGYMRGAKVERIYREVKVNAIGGGAEEIMKDLASRQMGL
jgi:acyl-CoA dehydrogenase